MKHLRKKELKIRKKGLEWFCCFIVVRVVDVVAVDVAILGTD